MIKAIHAAIIEDEIPAARLLSSMVSRLRPDWKLTVLPGNVEQSIEWFANHPHPDLLFLDIQLSDGNSFDFLSQAHPDSIIVFTTAYDEYAIRAFGVNSIDYILKPVDQQRLQEAIMKYETMTFRRHEGYLDDILECLRPTGKRFRTRFLVSGADQLWTLQVSDIAYFYSENRVTFAVEHSAREHVIDLSLDRLIEQLCPDQFFRANRQIILSVSSVKRIEPYFNGKIAVHIKPTNREKITISKERIASFKLWLNY